MYATGARSSLMSRIAETQRRSAAARDETPRQTRRETSFVERYRGTEYETVRTVLVARKPMASRGRTFVVVSGVAAVGLFATMLMASSG
jgi:hypothetical protein